MVQPTPSSRISDSTVTAAYHAPRSIPAAPADQLRPGLDPRDGSSSNARTSRGASPEGEAATLNGQYAGPTSSYSFLRRAWRRFGLTSSQQEEKEPNQAVSIFSYGDRQQQPADGNPASLILPSRHVTAELFSNYFDFSMPTYRFLHQPTVSRWLSSYHDQQETGSNQIALLPVRQAIVLMCLATASLFKVESLSTGSLYNEGSQDAEAFFQAAQSRLGSETGKPRLESVQARMAACLYLMHTSRPNQAWYTFGITVQILMALGMHRNRPSTAPHMDCITSECRKRVFWSAYALDTYLSVILGRPALIHIDDVDQQFPEALDDDELTAEGIAADRSHRDRVIQASIYHAKITQITKKASREQYSVQRHRDAHKLNVATKLNAQTAEWQASLPVVLSGAIHPSSLIQIFQRQIIVLKLAHAHALILINRPLLLVESKLDNSTHVDACLTAAKSTLDTVLGFVSDTRTFPAFWFTQYVTFTALSIVYIWLIQRRRGRLASLRPPFSDNDLFQLAETIQRHLSEATHTNAPSLRYSIILEELQQETKRLMRQNNPRPPSLSGLLETPTEGHPYATPANASDGSPESNRTSSFGFDALGGDFALDPDLWLQLESFPYRKFAC